MLYDMIHSMRRFANYLTIGRMLGSFLLLLLKPFSSVFYLVYILCGVSDMLDGPIARSTGSPSRFGATLDSVADYIFIAAAMVVFLPLFPWRRWMLFWIAAIALTRFLSLIFGYVKYHAFASLHTYANKLTGGVLFLLPLAFPFWGFVVPVSVGCAVASFSAAEELVLTLRSNTLDRDAQGLFFQKKQASEIMNSRTDAGLSSEAVHPEPGSAKNV